MNRSFSIWWPKLFGIVRHEIHRKMKKSQPMCNIWVFTWAHNGLTSNMMFIRGVTEIHFYVMNICIYDEETRDQRVFVCLQATTCEQKKWTRVRTSMLTHIVRESGVYLFFLHLPIQMSGYAKTLRWIQFVVVVVIIIIIMKITNHYRKCWSYGAVSTLLKFELRNILVRQTLFFHVCTTSMAMANIFAPSKHWHIQICILRRAHCVAPISILTLQFELRNCSLIIRSYMTV